MSVLLSPAVASEESEKNPKTDPTAAKRSTRTPTGRSEVPGDKKSHESVALGKGMKNRKVEREAAALGFLDLHWLLPLPSIFTMGMEGSQIAEQSQIFVVWLLANVFVCVRERGRERGWASFFVALNNKNCTHVLSRQRRVTQCPTRRLNQRSSICRPSLVSD